MSFRYAWTWLWGAHKDMLSDSYLIALLRNLEGRGSDHLWFIGVTGGSGSACSTLPRTKQPDLPYNFDYFGGPYGFDPNTEQGRKNRESFAALIKGGVRWAGQHTMGDLDQDYAMDIIEQASKEAGMTLEQIRAKRHVHDHMGMNPRPDQIARHKNLGMQISGWDLYIWEGSPERTLREYGEQAVQWVVPRKSLYDAGVRNSVEIDRAIAATNITFFTVLYSGITRKDMDGKVWVPQQAISREAMLKSATLWGAYYALREDKVGSLEAGKWADLMVIDSDYLTIPVDEILNARVLMTMVGGKIQHLVPSLAREWGMQPTGAQVELGGNAARW